MKELWENLISPIRVLVRGMLLSVAVLWLKLLLLLRPKRSFLVEQTEQSQMHTVMSTPPVSCQVSNYYQTISNIQLLYLPTTHVRPLYNAPLSSSKVVKIILFHTVWQHHIYSVSACSNPSLGLYNVDMNFPQNSASHMWHLCELSDLHKKWK